ncbi:MAG: hypothetical protein U9N76_00860 [Candidatus Marinimicrobia bacterium]|nr:hypothetical protein [Candidatus Neomarinimicrobiota bacterium]
MKANISILENVSAYKIAIESKNIKMQNTIIDNIISQLKTAGINNSEFISYWALKDMSYSSYEKYNKNTFIQKEFLKKIIPEFIKDRHLLYSLHSYSFTTLQAIADSKAHKSSGNLANKKISSILNDFDFLYFDSDNLQTFSKSKKVYIFPDKKNKKLLKKILKKYNINFKWSNDYVNKTPDCLIKNGKSLFIMEHKHKKEGGGGQNDQILELIDFISYNEKNVSYISFIDGIYFNLLADKRIKEGKVFSQREKIIENLRKNENNYFVNTKGFKKLLKSLK